MNVTVYRHSLLWLLIPAVMTLVVGGCRGENESAFPLSDDTNPSRETTNSPSGNRLISIILERSEESKRERFVLTGLSPGDLSKMLDPQSSSRATTSFTVHVINKDGTLLPEMLGRYYQQEDAIIFEPRYSLSPGVTYRAIVMQPQLTKAEASDTLSKEFSIEARSPKSQRTRLVAVYPSSDHLPSNQLKFYFHFSAPMSLGDAYSCIELRDSNNDLVSDVFLELGEELWDPMGMRFTLLLDPGRIKRGLKPRALLGPSLITGESYTLIVSKQWKDANSQPLSDPVTKYFTVGQADDTQPSPDNWNMDTPSSGTRDALVITLDEPLDHAMLEWAISVQGSSGSTCEGIVGITDQETKWNWTPERKWKKGSYMLIIDTTLEDRAGNSIGRPFEVLLSKKKETNDVSGTILKTFDIP